VRSSFFNYLNSSAEMDSAISRTLRISGLE